MRAAVPTWLAASGAIGSPVGGATIGAVGGLSWTVRADAESPPAGSVGVVLAAACASASAPAPRALRRTIARGVDRRLSTNTNEHPSQQQSAVSASGKRANTHWDTTRPTRTPPTGRPHARSGEAIVACWCPARLTVVVGCAGVQLTPPSKVPAKFQTFSLAEDKPDTKQGKQEKRRRRTQKIGNSIISPFRSFNGPNILNLTSYKRVNETSMTVQWFVSLLIA